MKNITNIPRLFLSSLLGLIFSWYLKNTFTAILYWGKVFDDQGIVFQMVLISAYTIILTSISLLILFLLEEAHILQRHYYGIISKNYGNIALVSVIVILLIYPLNYVINYLSFPYPLEYREMASISAAYDFSNGINLYTLQNYPDHIYLYGLMYPLLLSLFVKLVSFPLLAARSVDVFFLILFLGMSFWIFRVRKASFVSSLTGVLILLNSICFIWTINGARPDIAGLFFSLFGICLLLKNKLDTSRIIMCAFSCVLSFYFKQYMIFSTLIIGIFLLFFASKQKGILFISAVIILGLASFIVIRNNFPLYYEYSILHHIIASVNNTSLMVNQTYDFIRNYWVICLLYIYYLFRLTTSFIKNKTKEIHLMPSNIKEPLIQGISIELFDIGILVSFLILTFWLGRHVGNTYTYYGELLLPFLLYLIIPKIDELFKAIIFRNLIIFFILGFCVFPFRQNLVSDFPAWKEAFIHLSQIADNCSNIYDETPLAGYYKIEHEIHPVYNNGQIDYAKTIIPESQTIFGRISMVPPDLFIQRLIKWNSDIKSNIKTRKFDCIFSENKNEIENYHQIAKIEKVLDRTIYVRAPNNP
jgi:hypothetical protein